MYAMQHTDTVFNFIDGSTRETFTIGRGNGIETEEQAYAALLSGFKLERITRIKAEAQERIYAIVPAWKQSNFNARTNELNMIRFEREWNHEELAEIAFMSMVWESVKEIRANSTAAEAAVNAATTIQEINSVEF